MWLISTATLFLLSSLLITQTAVGYSVRNIELPTLRVVVVPSSSNNPSRDEIVLHKPAGSDLIVGNGEEIPVQSRLTLECDAAYPVQFIYTGDGVK